MKKERNAYIYAIAAVLMWATVASAFKIALRYLDFLQLLLYSSVVSSAVLFAILLVQSKLKLLTEYSGKDYLHSLILGFVNPFLYYLVLLKAYSLLPAQEAQPLNYTWPIMLVLLSIPLLKQRIGFRSITAIIVSFIGVLTISTRGDLVGFRFTNVKGVVLALSSSIIWALFWIYNVRDRRDVVAKLFLSFTFGSIFAAASVFLFSTMAIRHTAHLLGAVYVGLFEMGIAFVIWLKALELSRTTAHVSNLVYVAPFLSLLIVRCAVGERILYSTVIGLALIVAGLVMQRKFGNAA